MILLGLLFLKLATYYGVCLLAPRLLGVSPRAAQPFAIAWASVRIGLGLLFGVLLFYAIGYALSLGFPAEATYIGVMLVARIGLWWLTASLIQDRNSPVHRRQPFSWVATGVAASFAIDGLAVMAGADSFKFFC